MNYKQIFISAVVVCIVLFAMPLLANSQCSMCNATASTSTEGNKESAMALNSGILFLMAIPYLILTTLVVIWWKFRQQKRKEQSV